MPSKRFAFDVSGSSAIEFAILGPIFIALILGAIAYGIYFSAAHSVQQIAADAARTAIAGLTEQERKKLTSEFIRKNANAYSFVSVDKLEFSIGDSLADPNQFTVRVTYDAKGLPIWNLFAGLPLPGTTIDRTSTIRIGGI